MELNYKLLYTFLTMIVIGYPMVQLSGGGRIFAGISLLLFVGGIIGALASGLCIIWL